MRRNAAALQPPPVVARSAAVTTVVEAKDIDNGVSRTDAWRREFVRESDAEPCKKLALLLVQRQAHRTK